MTRSLLRVLACSVPLAGALSAGRSQTKAAANPVRKVVLLLQKMQKKVEAEGEEAQDLYEKFMCYCKTSGGALAASIEAAASKGPELESALKASESRKTQLEDDLKTHQKDRSAAKDAMAEATEIRKKEQASYDKELADNTANLAATKKATAAIAEGMGSFLQTSAADTLRKFVSAKQDMAESDRQDVLSFLSGEQQGEYAPASGEIVGILNTMADEMQATQDDLVKTEEAAVKDFEALSAAKKKEVSTLTGAIESKMTRVGELGVEIATMKNDAEDTAEALAEDQKFVADLDKNCAEKTGIHEEEKKLRGQEVVALADTIKILNDDDALDLFKKTLPGASASFLQVQVSSEMVLSQARTVLQAARAHSGSARPRVDFILLALNGKKAGFGKIVKMIDELVASLKAEQGDDDDKKEYCEKQLDETEDKIKGLQASIADTETAVEEAKESRAKLMEEIAALKVGIVALDKALGEATDLRKREEADYKDLVKSDTAAKELILFAKNRLNKFYNPKLYKAPPKRQLSEGDQIFENNGGDVPQEAAGGIAGTGIEAFVQVASSKEAPPPPPATAEAYSKKSQESNGVLAMCDLLVKDLDKELQVAEVEEKNSKEEYETLVADSSEKRREDSKALTGKEAAKGDLEEMLEKYGGEKKASEKELMGASKYLGSLHGECDWLVKYFDVRKQARADEVDSLGKAKAVLSGADFS